jgi:hypothetical protein
MHPIMSYWGADVGWLMRVSANKRMRSLFVFFLRERFYPEASSKYTPQQNSIFYEI